MGFECYWCSTYGIWAVLMLLVVLLSDTNAAFEWYSWLLSRTDVVLMALEWYWCATYGFWAVLMWHLWLLGDTDAVMAFEWYLCGTYSFWAVLMQNYCCGTGSRCCGTDAVVLVVDVVLMVFQQYWCGTYSFWAVLMWYLWLLNSTDTYTISTTQKLQVPHQYDSKAINTISAPLKSHKYCISTTQKP